VARKFLNGNAETGPLTVTQPVTTTGAPVLATFTGAANTGLTAATEVNDIYWNLSRTVTWATTVPTTQRAIYINASSLTYVAGSTTQTITTAATFTINGAPAGGTNVTITVPLALWVESGNTLLAGNLSVSGKVLPTASGTGQAGLNLGIGVAPTSPVSGDIWSTSNGTYGYSNTGGTVGPFIGGAGGSANTFAYYTGAYSLTSSSSFGFSTQSGATIFTAASGTSTATSPNGYPGFTSSITFTGALSSGNVISNEAQMTASPGGASTATYIASFGLSTTSGLSANNMTGATLVGALFEAYFTTTSTTTGIGLAALYGIQAAPTVNLNNTSGAITVTAAYGIAVLPGSFNNSSGGTGVVTTYYGLYLGALTLNNVTVGTRYGVYQADATAVNSFLGKVNLAASTTGFAPANLGQGTAPSAPVNGDLWITSAGLYAQVNSATVGPFGAGGGVSGSGLLNGQFVYATSGTAISSTSGMTYALTSGAVIITNAAGTSTATTATNAYASSITFTGAAGSVNLIGDQTSVTIAPGAASTAAYIGVYANPACAAVANVFMAGASIYGGSLAPSFATSNTTGAAVLGSLVGLQVAPSVGSSNATGTNTVANVYGLNVVPGTWTASGGGGLTVTNYYGLYLGPVTLSTTTISNRYGIFQNDIAATNSFSGPTLFGNTFANTTALNVVNVTNVFTGAVSSATMTGLYSNVTPTPGSAASNAIYAASYNVIATPTSIGAPPNSYLSTSSMISGYFSATMGTNDTSGVLVLATLSCVQAIPSVVSSNTSGTSSITSVYGLQVAPGTFSSTGGGGFTIANYYGLYLGTVSLTTMTMTNRYGIYQADANAVNYFAGAFTQTFSSSATSATTADLTTATFTGNAGSVNLTGLESTVIGTPSAASTASYLGLWANPSISSAANVFAAGAALVGLYASPAFATANTTGATVLATLAGVYVSPSVVSTNATGTNTVTSVYGLNVSPGTFSSTGGGGLTVTNYYGLYLGTVTLTTTTITNRYGVYQTDGAAANFFAGKATVANSTFTNTSALSTVIVNPTFTGAVTGTAFMVGTASAPTATPGSASAALYAGFQSTPSVSSAANAFAASSILVGYYSNPTFNTGNTSGTTVLAAIEGFSSAPTIATTNATGTNIVTSAYGYYALLTATATGGGGLTVTNYYGIYLATASLTTATITNNYGVYQQDGAATNVFAGKSTFANSNFATAAVVNGVAVSPNFTGTTAGNSSAILVSATLAPTGANTSSYFGLSVGISATSATTNYLTGATIYGVYTNPTFNTANTATGIALAAMAGLNVVPNVVTTNASGTNTVSNVYALLVQPTFTAAAGPLVISSYFGLYLAPPTLTNATIGNHWGIFINDTTCTNYLGGAKFSVFGGAGQAQLTGWGTPTGNAVVANFSGSAATLVQCSNAIAEIIAWLKAVGFFGA
jgi:hypothetical protein